MAILAENIKLMASQRLTDRDDGGGRITGIEIVDGNVNNLFPDISRLDRVYGRVSLRKAFVAVQTSDTATYSGAHVILSKPAADPKVSVCMFSTGDPNDERAEARDRVESYVTVGPRFAGWLWGNQPEGSRSILMFCVKGTATPDIGGSLCLFNSYGLVNEEFQYVRITAVERTTSEFSSDGGVYGAAAQTFSRDILRIDIGDALRTTFVGVEISKNDSVATSVFTTIVSDASKYYGVMLPTSNISSGDIAINVDSIFANLVPSAQGESQSTDMSIGEAGPVVGTGVSHSISIASIVIESGTQAYFCRGIAPGSLSMTSVGHSYTDKSDGIIYEGLSQVGKVDYSTGTVTFTNLIGSYSSSLLMTAKVGVEILRVPESITQTITVATRGYNYVKILNPLPTPGTVWVDYMSQGKWYRLRDNGAGLLVPDIDGTGTGTINYVTGSLTVTCAALPDTETSIIFNWANPVESVDLSGVLAVDVAEVNHLLENAPVAPGSLTISWPVGIADTGDAIDNGAGVITGDATGYINYSTGEISFKPTLLPTSDGEYTIDYERYTKISGVYGGAAGSIINFLLPEGSIKPGSVNIDVVVAFGSYQHTYRMTDNGSGGLSAPGWEIKLAVNHINFAGSTTMSGISGTVDYVTRAVSINASSMNGMERWTPAVQYIRTIDTANSGYTHTYWCTEYQYAQFDVLTAVSMSISNSMYSYTLAASAAETRNEILAAKPFELSLLRNGHGYAIVPNSVSFTWGTIRYIDRLGKIYRNPDPKTGLGVEAGSIDYETGIVTLSVYDGGANSLTLHSMTGRIGRQLLSSAAFRTPGAPLRPESLSLLGVTHDGLTVSATSSSDGSILGQNVKGRVDYEKGIVFLEFGSMVNDSIDYADEPWYDPENIVGGKIFKPNPVYVDSLVYACVVYSYIPLKADLIGLDAVRLPTDGRVPIVRVGDVVVVHNTKTDQLANPLTQGMVITPSRENISSVEVYDSSPLPLRVPSTKYAFDKDDQKLTMATPLDLTGFVQPLILMHRIEDMALVSGVQINGQLTVATGLENDYPADGTYVSTALLFGDLQSRAYGLFDQVTWTSVWSDNQIGSSTSANYNEINYPITVTNAGTVRERWALVFAGTDHFNIIGEKYGVVGTGYISNDCNPINPSTGQPFFFIDYRGWGAGWAVGNVLRFNTEGAIGDLWIARTSLQGPATEPSDMFTLQIRGDAE